MLPSRVFQKIYTKNRWLFGSGEGSLPEITQKYREFLQKFLREKNIRTVVDIGCGDWQFSRLIDWSSIQYLGLDVVPEIIKENQRLFGSQNISFAVSDVSREAPPPADLVLVKDVFQHWPNAAIQRWLPKLNNYRYGLITNDADERTNVDIAFGEHRAVDITLPPFNTAVEKVLEYSGVDVSGKPWRKVTYLWATSA
ncbi:MAG: class I SAM-dependent methyltransferase [Patescibacteria group bacterium]